MMSAAMPPVTPICKWILLKQRDSARSRGIASKKAGSERRTQTQGNGHQIGAVTGYLVPSHTQQNEAHEEKKRQCTENRANYHNPWLGQRCRMCRHVDNR